MSTFFRTQMTGRRGNPLVLRKILPNPDLVIASTGADIGFYIVSLVGQVIIKILLEKNAISDVRRLTYGDNWLLKLPSAVRKEYHITKDGEMRRLKGQKGIFRHLVFGVHAIDDIKKAYIKEYNRMYKNEEEIYDYFVDKIFLKAYNAQLKRPDDKDGVFTKIMNSVRQDNVEELLREIEEREKNKL